jgi:hypothetical protein
MKEEGKGWLSRRRDLTGAGTDCAHVTRAARQHILSFLIRCSYYFYYLCSGGRAYWVDNWVGQGLQRRFS